MFDWGSLRERTSMKGLGQGEGSEFCDAVSAIKDKIVEQIRRQKGLFI